MLRLSLLAAILLLPSVPVPAAASCAGADPAITSAVLKSITPDGALNDVKVAVTVTNLGSQGQPSNTLQSIEILQNVTKVGMKGIPPLAAGKSYTFLYQFQRSGEAAPDTTPLRFHLIVTQPSNVDCNPSNDEYRLRV